MTLAPGKRLERLVAALHHAETKGAEVTWNDVIDGRQFDVAVRFKFGLHSYLTVIECKDYSSKVSVDKVDAFVTKARDAKANKAVLVSASGFQSGCIAVAERHGIELLVLSETSDTSMSDLVERFVPGLNILDVRFRRSAGAGTIALEDWAGRLAYLMDQSTLTSAKGQATPRQLVDKWQLEHPSIHFDGENQVEIPLPPGTELRQPHEEAVQVEAMLFTCRLIQLGVPKDNHPLLDNHVLQGNRTRIELRDAQGNIKHSTRLADLPLGYDTPVQVGRFYESSASFRYYCEKIEGDLVTWTLVESYQHGRLIQAKYTQKIEYAKTYVHITDPQVLARLQRMLERIGR